MEGLGAVWSNEGHKVNVEKSIRAEDQCGRGPKDSSCGHM